MATEQLTLILTAAFLRRRQECFSHFRSRAFKWLAKTKQIRQMLLTIEATNKRQLFQKWLRFTISSRAVEDVNCQGPVTP
jgi:hypothetical protein